MEAPLVSIVIVCMNRMDNLYPCLEGLRAHTGVSCETFVVAYRFSPENLAKAQADFPLGPLGGQRRAARLQREQ